MVRTFSLKTLSLVIYLLNLQFLLQSYRSFVFIGLISGLLYYYEDVELNGLGLMPLTLLKFQYLEIYHTLSRNTPIFKHYLEITRIRMKFSVQQCFQDFCMLYYHSLSIFRNQDQVFLN